METIYNMLFAVQFFVVIGIFLYRLYNIMKQGILYDIAVSFILFILFMIAWFIGLIITLLNPDVIFLNRLLMLENILMTLNTLFFIFELFFFLKITAENKAVQARNSLAEYGR